MGREREFLHQILCSADVVGAIRGNLSRLVEVMPEIVPMIGFEHRHPHHYLDVWEHTLCALSFAPNDFDIRFALLLHDIGKPHSFQDGVDGVRHFKGHPEESARFAKCILKRFGFNDEYIDFICEIVVRHDTPIKENDIIENLHLFKKIFEVQKCDVLAHNPENNNERLEYLSTIGALF